MSGRCMFWVAVCVVVEFNRMKEELPKGYSKSSGIKMEPGKSETSSTTWTPPSIAAGVKDHAMEQGGGGASKMEDKCGGGGDGPTVGVSGPPSEGNVATAAAAALASAAVKAKVSGC